MLFRNWVEILAQSLQEMWLQFASFLPSLIGALVVFFIGLIVASVLGQVVARLITSIKFDNLLKKLGINEYLERADMKLNTGRFFGEPVHALPRFWQRYARVCAVLSV